MAWLWYQSENNRVVGGLNYQSGIYFMDLISSHSKKRNTDVLNKTFAIKIPLPENIDYWNIWCILNISQPGIPDGWLSDPNKEECSC